MTCRCLDLRRALLGLVRAAKRNESAIDDERCILPEFEEWPEGVTEADVELVQDELVESRSELMRSLRRARRLLRETRPQKRGAP